MIKRILAVFCVLVATCCQAHGEPRLTRTVLPNGMTVILQENHDMPWASVNIFVRSGGLWEDESTNGISHFYEHLFFRGTSNRTGTQMKQQIEGLGAQTNAETSKDFTHFFVNLPSVHVPDVLPLMADALINASLDPKAIEIERQAVLDEYRMDADSAVGELQEKLFASAFKAHPYRLPVIGTEANINRFKQADFVAWKRRYYVPERTALIVVGDFKTEQIMPQVKQLFGPFASTGESIPKTPAEAPLTDNVMLKQAAPMHGGVALIGYRAPPVKNYEDVYAVDVMSFLLGQGKTCLLNAALVTDKDVAQGVSLDFLTQRDDGLIILSLAASAPRLGSATTAALGIIGDVQNDKFTDAALEKARSMLIASFTQQDETCAGIASTLGFYEMIDKSSFAVGYLDGIRKVTRKDIVRVAKKYLGAPYVKIEALPRRMIDAGGDAPLPKPTTTVK